MECQFCHQDVQGLIRKFVYGDGIWVCHDCYEKINKHKCHPYSQVMEEVAMLEAGYHVNCKLARARKH